LFGFYFGVMFEESRSQIFREKYKVQAGKPWRKVRITVPVAYIKIMYMNKRFPRRNKSSGYMAVNMEQVIMPAFTPENKIPENPAFPDRFEILFSQI